MEYSEYCRFHPEERAAANCQKSGYGLCAECLDQNPVCSQPRQHCKFREQCVIFFRYKEARRERAAAGGES